MPAVETYFQRQSMVSVCILFKENAIRIFRISRIRELDVTDRFFKSISKENMPFPLPSMDKVIKIELSFSKKVAYRVYDIFEDSMITETEDSLIVKSAVPENEWLFGFLMSFGDRLTILNPAYLKDVFIISGMQKACPKNMLGRLMALFNLCNDLTLPIGIWIHGIIYEKYDDKLHVVFGVIAMTTMIMAAKGKKVYSQLQNDPEIIKL